MKLVSRKEARSAGLLRYFTGGLCSKRRHRAERYVSNGECVECGRIRAVVRQRRLYWADPDFRKRVLDQCKDYLARNRPAVNERQRARYAGRAAAKLAMEMLTNGQNAKD